MSSEGQPGSGRERSHFDSSTSRQTGSSWPAKVGSVNAMVGWGFRRELRLPESEMVASRIPTWFCPQTFRDERLEAAFTAYYAKRTQNNAAMVSVIIGLCWFAAFARVAMLDSQSARVWFVRVCFPPFAIAFGVSAWRIHKFPSPIILLEKVKANWAFVNFVLAMETSIILKRGELGLFGDPAPICWLNSMFIMGYQTRMVTANVLLALNLLAMLMGQITRLVLEQGGLDRMVAEVLLCVLFAVGLPAILGSRQEQRLRAWFWHQHQLQMQQQNQLQMQQQQPQAAHMH